METYQAMDEDDISSSSGEEVVNDDDMPLGTVGGMERRVRRGSEGYEVRSTSREQMLRQYLESVGEDYDRYIRYIPEPESESDEGVEAEASEVLAQS